MENIKDDSFMLLLTTLEYDMIMRLRKGELRKFKLIFKNSGKAFVIEEGKGCISSKEKDLNVI
jgi:hypothetical protein